MKWQNSNFSIIQCAHDIIEELHRNFAELEPSVLNILCDLAENAESERAP